MTSTSNLALSLSVLLTACSAPTMKSDASVAVDAGTPDAGRVDGLVDSGVFDAGFTDAGVHPCALCPAGAFCWSDGGCDYGCAGCRSDVDCGPRHRCWKDACYSHQPDCTDASHVTGVRLELDWCSGFGSIPLCQRVIELPFDGGLATLRQEPVGPGDGGVFTMRLTPASSLVSAFVDAGLTCIDQPRLDQLNQSCVTHSGEERLAVFTSIDVRRFAWGASASIRPPRAVDIAATDALRLLHDTLADAGLR